MWHGLNQDGLEDLYLAGERVLPGIYREIEGTRELRFEQEDVLPASLDGRVACYMRVGDTWGQMAHQIEHRI